jgi:hypothetical protein
MRRVNEPGDFGSGRVKSEVAIASAFVKRESLLPYIELGVPRRLTGGLTLPHYRKRFELELSLKRVTSCTAPARSLDGVTASSSLCR